MFPCCSTYEDLSIDASITYVGLILTMLRGIKLFSTSQNTSQNLIWNYFDEKNQIFGFPCCSNHEDLSIDASITNVGLILTKPEGFLRGTDRQTRFWNPHTKNFNSKLKISGHLSTPICLPGGRGCIVNIRLLIWLIEPSYDYRNRNV